ncbi:MAG: hypothetical protein JWM25_1802, partial [Thermoleophilia bacterium]|nr:hypothetical protein [Thermoleophilia bacterium]
MPRLRAAVLAPIATVTALFFAPTLAHAELAVGIAGTAPANDLVTFDTATPGRFASVPLTGLGTTYAPVALDVRPSNGGIYVLGLNVQGVGGNDNIGQLFVVNPVSGAATAVGAPFASNLADSTDWGFDFNPTSDTIRLVDSNGLNLRINPDTGAGSSDGPITGSNDLRAVAYDRNTTSGTGTTLYGISAATGLVTISLSTFASTPIGNDAYAATTSFDISGASGTAFVASGTALQTINLADGEEASTSALQSALVGFSIVPSSTVQVNPPAVTTTEATGYAKVTVTRTRALTNPATLDIGTVDGSAKADSD